MDKFRTIFAAFFVVFLPGSLTHANGLESEYEKEVSKVESYVNDFITHLNVSAHLKWEISEIWRRSLDVLSDTAVVEDLKKFEKLKRLPHDDDAERNASELIRSKGFQSEEYYVTTADGFILSVIRVLPANSKPSNSTRPLFLLHGLLSSCDCFINNFRDQSLAYILVDHGYDVWLGNVRGSRYSTRHQSLSPKDKKFWKWSFDEIGLYDVPVMVDFVLSQTGTKTLDFIGHSEGTTNLITSVIANGELMADKINKFIALAPAVYVSHAKGLLKILSYAARIIQKTWDKVNEGDVFAHDGIISWLGQRYCYDFPWICVGVVESMVGPGLGHFNTSRVPVYLSHAPAGTSTQNMVHWSQQCDGGYKLTYYDYGSWWKNYEHYHQRHPPVYDLKKFTVSTYAFLGTSDWLVRPVDGNRTLEDLPDVVWKKFYNGFTHIDFVWGYNVKDTLIRDILNILTF